MYSCVCMIYRQNLHDFLVLKFEFMNLLEFLIHEKHI